MDEFRDGDSRILLDRATTEAENFREEVARLGAHRLERIDNRLQPFAQLISDDRKVEGCESWFDGGEHLVEEGIHRVQDFAGRIDDQRGAASQGLFAVDPVGRVVEHPRIGQANQTSPVDIGVGDIVVERSAGGKGLVAANGAVGESHDAAPIEKAAAQILRSACDFHAGDLHLGVA